MGKEHTIGFEIRWLFNLIKRENHSRPTLQTAGTLTGMHGWVIGYLYEHQEQEVFQKDLEAEFHVRRSTATGILKLMERNGLILRLPVERDARPKKLILTEKAIAMHEDVMREITDIENKMQEGIPEEDLAVFFRTLDKIKQNLGAGECCCPCRTEDKRLQGGKRPL